MVSAAGREGGKMAGDLSDRVLTDYAIAVGDAAHCRLRRGGAQNRNDAALLVEHGENGSLREQRGIQLARGVVALGTAEQQNP